jgi:hypothetical protein
MSYIESYILISRIFQININTIIEYLFLQSLTDMNSTQEMHEQIYKTVSTSCQYLRVNSLPVENRTVPLDDSYTHSSSTMKVPHSVKPHVAKSLKHHQPLRRVYHDYSGLHARKNKHSKSCDIWHWMIQEVLLTFTRHP